MACDRCGAQIAMDTCAFTARLRAQNGQPLVMRLTIVAARDLFFQHPVMFCESCFGAFIEQFATVGEALRLKGVQAIPAGSLDRPDS